MCTMRLDFIHPRGAKQMLPNTFFSYYQCQHEFNSEAYYKCTYLKSSYLLKILGLGDTAGKPIPIL